MPPIVEVFQEFDNPDPNYTELYRRFGYLDINSLKPWSTIARMSSGNASILDLGCGAGRIAIPLHQLGYDVTGVDINIDMLNLAKEFCSELKTVHSSIEHLRLEQQFDGVILASLLLCNCDDLARFKILASAVRHLKIGGWLAFELYNSSWVKKNGAFTSDTQEIVWESSDPDISVYSGRILYFFDEVHYLQRFTTKIFEDSSLKQYLKSFGLSLTQKFPASPISYVYLASFSRSQIGKEKGSVRTNTLKSSHDELPIPII